MSIFFFEETKLGSVYNKSSSIFWAAAWVETTVCFVTFEWLSMSSSCDRWFPVIEIREDFRLKLEKQVKVNNSTKVLNRGPNLRKLRNKFLAMSILANFLSYKKNVSWKTSSGRQRERKKTFKVIPWLFIVSMSVLASSTKTKSKWTCPADGAVPPLFDICSHKRVKKWIQSTVKKKSVVILMLFNATNQLETSFNG